MQQFLTIDELIVADMHTSGDKFGLSHVLPRRKELILIIRAIEDDDLDDLSFFDKRYSKDMGR